LLRIGLVGLVVVMVGTVPTVNAGQLTETQRAEEPADEDSSEEEFFEDLLITSPGTSRLSSPPSDFLHSLVSRDGRPRPTAFRLGSHGDLANRNGLGAPLRC